MAYKVSVVGEKDEHSRYPHAPELEGCQAQGDSFHEIIENIREAIALYLQTPSQEEASQQREECG
jgi:predicted RNase H-like HicB family nuclease